LQIRRSQSLLALLGVLLAFAAPAFALNATWNTAADVPVTAASYTAGGTVNFTLNFTPATGTNLTVVKNTGLPFISGTFSNLAQGQGVALGYGGVNYNFVANYYGGSGNDLVLQWANTRPLAWGNNGYGQLGNGNSTSSSVPVPVNQGGVLFGKTVTALAAGDSYSMALCSDGMVAAWGTNANGQLGNNSTTGSYAPVAVSQSGVLSGKTVISIAVGYSHGLALCSDGTVSAWGDNYSGKLGDNGAESYSKVPVAVVQSGVLSGKTVIAVAAGDSHSMALCSDGTVADWGNNADGQLGNNSTTNSSVPVAVSQSGVLAGKTVIAIAAGEYHSIALCSDGTVAGWGDNGYGQLGNSSTTSSPVPVAVNQGGVLSGKTVIAVAAGANHTLALCSDGTVAAWGYNSHGELGNGSTTSSSVPVAVSQGGVLSGKTVIAVASGLSHSTALCSDGTAAAWGYNTYGQLGNNSTTNSSVPVTVSTAGFGSGERLVAAASGCQAYHTLGFVASPAPAVATFAATSITTTSATLNGAVNASNNGSTAVSFDYGTGVSYGTNVAATPTPVTGNSPTAASAVLNGLSPGTTYHFRVNGVSTAGTSNGGDMSFRTISTDANLSNLALSAGTLSPAFSSGTTSYTASVPNSVTSITVTPTAADSNSTLKVNGATVISGNASVIKLNVGSNTITVLVTAQDGVTTQTYTVTVTEAAAAPLSWNYTAASDVPVTANGYGASGAATLSLNFAPPTGTNLMVVKNTAQAFIGGAFSNLAQGQVVTLSYGGANYTFVVNYYGGSGNDLMLQWTNVRPLAWGYNSNGQLGNSGTTSSSVPMAVSQSGVLAGKVVIAVAEGSSHSLALCSDGTVAAWGFNNVGQLGNGTTTSSTVPVSLSGLAGKTVIAIAAAQAHSLALCSDGTVLAWGSSINGELGTGAFNPYGYSTVPVAVSRTGALAGKTVIAVAAGQSYSLALCSDGTVAAWGYNLNGFFSATVPSTVIPSGALFGKTVIAVAAGGSHSLALCSDGTVVAWGYNGNGQLGNNSTSTSTVPVAVSQAGVLSGKTVIAVAAGASHSLALCSDGTVAAWGYNGYGQLGNNSTTQSKVPVAVTQTGVLSGKTVTAVAAGLNHTLAMCSDGTPAAWGYNLNGQLGNTSTTNSSLPVVVSTAGLAAGERFALTGSGPMANHVLGLVVSPLRSEAHLSSLAMNSGTLDPAFATGVTSYTASTSTASLTVSPVATDWLATITVNGVAVPSGGTSGPIDLAFGPNTITTVVTAQDGTTNTYSVTVNRAPLSWTYNAVTEVPDASSGYVASGAVTLSLNFAPPTGATLTVVRNAGPGFITGTFSNLAQGQAVTLGYGGVNYHFTANYYGGKGRDLVLQWADVRPVAWGNDVRGQLGDSRVPGYRMVPVPVLKSGALAGKTVAAVSMGRYYGVALCSDGTLAAWGDNSSGQLGNNSKTDSTVPVAVLQSGALSGKTVTAVAAGGYHTLALCSDGTIAAWGSNSLGQLGNNTTTGSQVPVAVDLTGVLAGKTITAVAAGIFHSLALCSDGSVAAWGSNVFGQLGNNTTTASSVPVAVNTASGLSGKTVTAIAAGLYHTLALCSDGTLAAWGDNAYGQLGNNSTTDSPVPAAVVQTGVLSGKTVTAVEAGSYHSLVLCSDGTLAAWGYGYNGELGNNGASPSSVPVAVVQNGVLAGKTITAVAAGGFHNLALCSDGTMTAWGASFYGELGGNNTARSLVPALVLPTGALAGRTPVALAAGYDASMAICSDGTLAAWGFDLFGELGDGGPLGYSQVPGAVNQSGVLAGKTVTAMSAGTDHTLALCSDGTLAAWGSNASGQLGNNSTTDSNVPVAVDQTGALAGRTVIAVAAGSSHSLALCSDGTVAAWGANSSGQLGNGNNAQSTAPVAVIQGGVLAGRLVTAIAAGGTHSLASCSDGTVAAWGFNGYGQLGNNATTNSSVPVAVVQGGVLSGKTVIAVAAGAYHSLALSSDGTLAAWGQNFSFQLGIGSFNSQSSVPVAVVQTGVLASKTVTAISAGQYHNLVLCSDGTLATWGYNGLSSPQTPAAVSSGALAGRTVVAIATGANHDLAWCSDGTLAAWGDNFYGQLGIDSTTDSSVPAMVGTSVLATGEGFTAASSGPLGNHTLALVAAPPPPPVAVTLAATAITSTGATLNGSVNASGNSTGVSFDCGISTSYGTNVAGTPTPLTASTATPVSATLTGLTPGTTYHFRANGTSGAGRAHGGDLTFTTPATPQDWRMQWYGTPDNTGNAANDADPYGKGIQNLTVFALLGPGQNPATASIAQLPQVQTAGGNLFISFTEPPGVTGVTYGAESSATLQGDWQPVPDTGTGTLHIFSVPIGSNILLFLRLKLTGQ
jgi:alpha-tubulin suppressor-like RCC1 family protein